MTTTQNILHDVHNERSRQDEKWGPQQHSWCEWMAILTEEVGEAAQYANAIQLGGCPEPEFPEGLRAELVQVAAVAVAAIEQLDNGTAETT